MNTLTDTISSSGYALMKSPKGGWNSTNLEAIFAQTVPRDTYNLTNTPPTPSTTLLSGATSTSEPTQFTNQSAQPQLDRNGIIAGSVAGSIVCVLAVMAGLWWFCIRRRKRSASIITANELADNAPKTATELADNAAVMQLPTKEDTAELMSREMCDSGMPIELDGRSIRSKSIVPPAPFPVRRSTGIR